jgi:hypothetical protein
MKLPIFNLKYFLVSLVLCASGGGLISFFSGMPFWGGIAIMAFALVVNGVIAGIEDNDH